jgi:Cu(I)/Ag(I) efflux system membrane fusion protein
VRAGQPIVDIFSQELFTSQVEYLAIRAMAEPPTAAAASGRARLRFFGMSDAAIDAIERSGKPQRVVTLAAPRSGILAHRGIYAGTAVDPSTEIATVLDLSRVWVWAEVPESSAQGVRQGTPARLELGADGAQRFSASVEFIDPVLTETTRKLKVRFSLSNAGGRLRPGAYGTAVFSPAGRRALTVPRDALVDTGDAQYVYVMTSEHGYQPRSVRPGQRWRDRVEIVDGLREGEKVVAAGVFLLDSESRLRASGGAGAAHAGHGQQDRRQAPAPSSGHGAGGALHD